MIGDLQKIIFLNMVCVGLLKFNLYIVFVLKVVIYDLEVVFTKQKLFRLICDCRKL